ncbi:MAG: carbamate kinase [Acidimicrobiales bacterium]|nr:carbamate kinase [Acidimicrobiales bacterium]
MLVVVSLGRNALLKRGERPDLEPQRANVEGAVAAIADVAARHQVVVTHGNGPQAGLLALQSESWAGAAPYTLDVVGAEAEGLIGYLLEQGLENALPGRDVATLLTQTVVDPSDPAFAAPSKPVGPAYTEHEAKLLMAERGWTVRPDERGRWRRLVASPEPVAIVEQRTIRTLVDNDVVVVCAGGGGIPVAVDERGAYGGVEAVVDKDLAAALLASRLGADALLLLTDMPAVMEGWGGPARRPIRTAHVATLRAAAFEAGSMAPKVEACCRFVGATEGIAAIGALDDAGALLDGEAGTRVLPGSGATTYHPEEA